MRVNGGIYIFFLLIRKFINEDIRAIEQKYDVCLQIGEFEKKSLQVMYNYIKHLYILEL